MLRIFKYTLKDYIFNFFEFFSLLKECPAEIQTFFKWEPMFYCKLLNRTFFENADILNSTFERIFSQLLKSLD